MRVARILTKKGEESYAVGSSQKNCITKDEIQEQTKASLPDNIDSFLCQNHTKKIKPKLASLSFSHTFDEFTLLPPIINSYKIICLAFNYSDQNTWIRFGKNPPNDPIIHMKPRTSLIGAFDSIICPKSIRQLDYEGELALFINKKGKDIPVDKALDYVGGYFILNDISSRDIQFADTQLTRAKSFDTFGPCGPWITTPDEISDPNNLKIITKVNGKIRQNSNTKNLVLNVQKLISQISKTMTLEPCDVISTGTPSGTALSLCDKGGEVFLKNGDVVEVRIEKLGKIKNKVSFVD